MNSAALNGYLTLLQELETNLQKSNTCFQTSLISCERFRQTRLQNVVKALNFFQKEGHKIEELDCKISRPIKEATWWENFVLNEYPEKDCVDLFKCSRKTYFYLIEILRPYITPGWNKEYQISAINSIKGVSVEKQVAILLHKVTRSIDYALTSSLFGIHKSTVHKILYKVIKAINKHLLHKVIYFPKKIEAKNISKRFEELYRIPQVVGVIESTHIPILPPSYILEKFINTQNYPSLVLQVIVDSDGWFRDISLKQSGIVSDERVLEESSIFKYANSVIPLVTRKINNIEVPYKVVGSTNYPLLPWLLTGYRTPETDSELLCNELLQEVHNHVELSIEKLKRRFAVLRQTIDISFKMAPQLVAVCCILHNIYERNGESLKNEKTQENNEQYTKFSQPKKTEIVMETLESSLLERDAIRDFLDTRFGGDTHNEETL